MKTLKYSFVLLFLSFCSVITAQISVSNPIQVDAFGSHVFLDASKNFSFEAGAPNSEGKGMVIPSCDLTSFEFNVNFVSSTDSPSYYDGMIVYNRVSGTTLTTGERSSTATVVAPGFYFFSNPDGATNENVTGGQWLPLGGAAAAAVKSKTVTAITATGTEATLDLGTTIIAANEVGSFIEAKVYNATGDLVLSATSAYDKATNVLTTGNGMINEVLPAGTYSVVVAYK